MKAVIVEIREGFAAVLSDNGSIEKIRNNNYEVGQVILMSKQKINISKKLAMCVASAASFVMLCGAGAWAYASPYTYVSLDVNPSIEYSLNRFDRVLSVKAINDDGEEFLEELKLDNYKNKSIKNAIAQTIDQISFLGYFDGDTEGGIVISTSGKSEVKAEELAAELQESTEQEVAKNGDNVTVEVISVGEERVKQAKELGVTPGKLNLVEKLQESAADPSSIDLETWLNKSVKEIMQATKENKKDEKAKSDSDLVLEDNSTEELVREEDKAADKQEKETGKTQKESKKAAAKNKSDKNKADGNKSEDNNNINTEDKSDDEEKVKDTETKSNNAEAKANNAESKANDEADKDAKRSEAQKETHKEDNRNNNKNK